MNLETGEIFQVQRVDSPDFQARLMKGDFALLEKLPRKSCKKCHGRGYVGRNLQTGKLIVCGCTKT